MGILHRRPARHFVDYHVKNDTKLIKWIKHHPVIYDKSHKYHGNKQEQEKIWECIAKGLNKTGMYFYFPILFRYLPYYITLCFS